MDVPRDTSPAIRAAQIAAFRRMSPAERVTRAVELSQAVRSLSDAGDRERASPDRRTAERRADDEASRH